MTHYTFPNNQRVVLPGEQIENRRARNKGFAAFATVGALVLGLGSLTARDESLDLTCTGITAIRHDRGNYALTPKITGTLPDAGYIALWADAPNGTDTVLEFKDLHAKYPPELARNAGRVVFSVAYNPDSTLSPDSTALPPGTQLAPCPAVDIK